MTKTELSKLIMDYGDFRVEANTLDELRNYETELVNRLYEAINYTRCCKSDSEQLNVSKTNPNFEEWLQTHEKFKDNTYVWGMGYVMSYADMKAKHKELIELNI